MPAAAPTLPGEPGLLLLAGVELLGTLMLEDMVGPLDVEADDGRLPSMDQVVLIMGSKLLIPGWSCCAGGSAYCVNVVGGTTKLLSMLTEETTGWVAAKWWWWWWWPPWWNPGTPPPAWPEAAGWSKRALSSPGSIGRALSASSAKCWSKSGG